MSDIYGIRSALKGVVVKSIYLEGIVTELILSKQIFKNNNEIGIFLREVLDIEFKSYVMKSRTMILARTLRVINSESDIISLQKKVDQWLDTQLNSDIKVSSKSKKTSNVDDWITK